MEQLQKHRQQALCKPGDTLSGIASTYGTTWQWLAEVNGIANPDLIYPGKTIRVR